MPPRLSALLAAYLPTKPFQYSKLDKEGGANEPRNAQGPSRSRITSGIGIALLVVLAYLFGHFGLRVNTAADDGVNWSRFAYSQYVTNEQYLCNSVMLFASLHDLESKADRIMLYPETMEPGSSATAKATELLLKAQSEYNVKLIPIKVVHKDNAEATWSDSYTKLLAFNQTQYQRVLNLDSDAVVLQPMDELFLLPSAPVAMPRAWWLDNPHAQLSDQIILIEPSAVEFARVQKEIEKAEGDWYDMDIVSALYYDSALVIPHRRYDLLTLAFALKNHTTYLGNDWEPFDADAIMSETKFLHFSDWPVPKPWIARSKAMMAEHQPDCVERRSQPPDCRAREVWFDIYHEFARRRKDICGMDLLGAAPDWDHPPGVEDDQFRTTF